MHPTAQVPGSLETPDNRLRLKQVSGNALPNLFKSNFDDWHQPLLHSFISVGSKMYTHPIFMKHKLLLLVASGQLPLCLKVTPELSATWLLHCKARITIFTTSFS